WPAVPPPAVDDPLPVSVAGFSLDAQAPSSRAAAKAATIFKFILVPLTPVVRNDVNCRHSYPMIRSPLKRPGARSAAHAAVHAGFRRNIFTDSYGIRGDQAGSDASWCVFSSRSL